MNKILNVQTTLLRNAEFSDHNINKCLLASTPVTFKLHISHDYELIVEKDGFFSSNVTLSIESFENTGTPEAPVFGEKIYSAKVTYSGMFIVQGFSPEELDIVLNVNCPSLVFPYARSEINRMLSETQMQKPQLQPVQFDMMYQNKKQKELENSNKEEENTTS
jgi:protein-export chaperone SecB